MGKILVIAEKPSVGRDIAKTLGCGQRGEGYLFSDAHIVSWSFGHLVELCEPEDYDESLKRWKAESLPIIPEEIKIKPIPKTRSQLTLLKKLMKSKEVDSIICATDSGREGELIFRYIYELAGCRKPFTRLWISSMTDAAIREGFERLRPGSEYDDLYLSAKCRSEADWLVGINATRAFTVRYGTLLSVGRVQTPTLAIIAARQEEINRFVPRDYWEVMARFTGYSGKYFDPATNETKIASQECAEAIADAVTGKSGVITSVKNEEKRQPPPLLYDLTELQRDCNKKFGFSAKKTLEIAQELYEKRKMITYPRTDSRYLSADMTPKLPDILKKLNRRPEYTQYASHLLELEQLPAGKRIIDDTKVTDHHAIIPTGAEGGIAPGTDAYKVFDLVARRFIAVFYPHYVYNITSVVTTAEGHSFLTKGKTVICPGWTELYGGGLDDGDEDMADALPALAEGAETLVESAEVQKKKTQPPKPYTEATLLSAMENAGRFIDDDELRERMKDSGLGTPATRAAIIERLLHVGYLERKGKTLLPTDKGMKLISIAPEELKSPETTGKWERALSSIAKGGMQPERFMGSIERYVHFIVEQAGQADAAVVFPKTEHKAKTTKGGSPSRGKRKTGSGKNPRSS